MQNRHFTIHRLTENTQFRPIPSYLEVNREVRCLVDDAEELLDGLLRQLVDVERPEEEEEKDCACALRSLNSKLGAVENAQI